MDRLEVSEVLERIQANRQSFLITNAVLNEWCEVLAPYDYFDVKKKLDDYFRDSDNFGRYPDVYYITKFLKTKEEKKLASEPHVLCQNCGQAVKFENYVEHIDRCNSADYIVNISKKYLDKTLSKEKLMLADSETFDKYYYSTCKLVYNKLPDGIIKHLIENVLLTYEGHKPNCDLEKILKEMSLK